MTSDPAVRFVHETLGQRVVFAPGAARDAAAEEVGLLGATRVMVVTSPREAERARRVTGSLPVVRVHTEVAEHVPAAVAQRARDLAAEHDADALVSVGGGSATGLAKAVALTTGLPVVAVPTTYAGSEATPVWGLTEGGAKTTGTDARVLPRSIVYDAALTLGLPVPVSVASGMNALAHGVDALWGPRADPLASLHAAEGARVLAEALPRVVDRPDDLAHRSQALYGAYLAAAAFASAGSGLHHRICHVLGGRHDLPHAPTHAAVLPHVLALNAPHAPDAERALARAFGAATATDGLARLRRRVGATWTLRGLGLPEAAVRGVAEAVAGQVPAGNPAPVDADRLEALLQAAWQGTDPRDA